MSPIKRRQAKQIEHRQNNVDNQGVLQIQDSPPGSDWK
jgi:hypothetical protein